MMATVAWVAATLVFATFFMKTIVPLRMLAIASNVAFVAYGLLGAQQGIGAQVLPILVLHVALLPLNLLRLHQVRRSIAAVRSMQDGPAVNDFLTPFMRARSCPAGTVLFRRGDKADLVYVLERGRARVAEFDKTLLPGDLFGEVAVFSEDARRSGTVVCDEDCELYEIPGEKLLELFYLDTRFAFQIARRLSRYA